MNFKNFLKECNEKEVFKKLSIYVVSSWVLIQVTSIVWEPLGLPKISVTYVLIILLIGLPLTGYLVWKYHLVKLEEKIPKLDKNGILIKNKFKKSKFQKMYFSVLSIVGVLSMLIVLVIINNNFFKSPKLSIVDSSDKIAVLRFGNNTGDSNFDIVGKMAADWIIHGITENKIGQVIDYELIESYSNNFESDNNQPSNENSNILNTYLKPKKIIRGNFYRHEDKLLFQGTVENGELREIVHSFKSVSCDSDSPIDCIESLKQTILGYLIAQDRKIPGLQETPPKYEAYVQMLNARANYADTDKFLDYLEKAIAIDSTYFEPKVRRVGHYYNQGDFRKADSILKTISKTDSDSDRQENLLNLYESLLAGNNGMVFNYMKKEYDIAPFDLESNQSYMVMALQFVNRPELVDDIYNEITMEEIDIASCSFCQFRIYVKAVADIELKRYETVIPFLENQFNIIDDDNKEILYVAYVRAGEIDKLENAMSKLKLLSASQDYKTLYERACVRIGMQYLILGNIEKASFYLDQTITALADDPTNPQYSNSIYAKKDFVNAVRPLELRYQADPENVAVVSKLAVTYHMLDKQEESDEMMSKLHNLRRPFQMGEVDYALAQYYAAVNDQENMYKYLMQAVANGYRFDISSFHNDPHFTPYVEDQQFQNILNFWHNL